MEDVQKENKMWPSIIDRPCSCLFYDQEKYLLKMLQKEHAFYICNIFESFPYKYISCRACTHGQGMKKVLPIYSN